MNEIEYTLVKSERGSITEMDLREAIEEYVARLPDPELVYKKSITFEGMIRYIHTRLIKQVLPTNSRYDYNLLDSIFNYIYIPLCSIYGFQPNIILFTILCDIPYTYVSKLGNGRIGDRTLDSKLISMVNKWSNACEAGLYSNVANHNSIGSMFLLKSVYGYQEQQTLRIETADTAPAMDSRQIAAGISEDLPLLPGQ